MAGDLTAVEARLRALLAPYAARLEASTIYGIPTMKRPDAKPSDWFAFVNPSAKHVALFLLPMVRHPGLVESVAPGLIAHRKGRTTLTFQSISDAEVEEVGALLARAFEVYTAGIPSPA